MCFSIYNHSGIKKFLMTNINLTKGNLELYDIQYVQIVYIQYICIYMYSLSSITAVSLIGK